MQGKKKKKKHAVPHFLEKTLWTSTDIQGFSLGEACGDLVHCTCP